MGLIVGFVAVALVSAMYGIFNQVRGLSPAAVAASTRRQGETLVEILVARRDPGHRGGGDLAGLQLSVGVRHPPQAGHRRRLRPRLRRGDRAVSQHHRQLPEVRRRQLTAPRCGRHRPGRAQAQQAAAEPLAATGPASGACPGRDTGIQRLRSPSSSDGRSDETLTLVVRRACWASRLHMSTRLRRRLSPRKGSPWPSSIITVTIIGIIVPA